MGKVNKFRNVLALTSSMEIKYLQARSSRPAAYRHRA